MSWRMSETPVSCPANGHVKWPTEWPSALTAGRWPCVVDWLGTARDTACRWGRHASWPSLYRDVTGDGGWKGLMTKACAMSPAITSTCYSSKEVCHQCYQLDSVQQSTLLSIDWLVYWLDTSLRRRLSTSMTRVRFVGSGKLPSWPSMVLIIPRRRYVFPMYFVPAQRYFLPLVQTSQPWDASSHTVCSCLPIGLFTRCSYPKLHPAKLTILGPLLIGPSPIIGLSLIGPSLI